MSRWMCLRLKKRPLQQLIKLSLSLKALDFCLWDTLIEFRLSKRGSMLPFFFVFRLMGLCLCRLADHPTAPGSCCWPEKSTSLGTLQREEALSAAVSLVSEIYRRLQRGEENMPQAAFRGWDLKRFLQTLLFFDALPRWLRQLCSGHLVSSRIVMMPESRSVMNFAQQPEVLVAQWGALDDVVMGGVSQSYARAGDNCLIFAGEVSTANAGGFVSVRMRNLEEPLNLTDWEGIELEVRGDGQRYKFFVRCETRWDGVAHAQSFDTIGGEWQVIRLPFRDFHAVFRAKTLPDAPLNPTNVYAFQLMLSKFEYDGMLNPHFQPGRFSLELRSIRVYGEQTGLKEEG